MLPVIARAKLVYKRTLQNVQIGRTARQDAYFVEDLKLVVGMTGDTNNHVLGLSYVHNFIVVYKEVDSGEFVYLDFVCVRYRIERIGQDYVQHIMYF